MGVITDVLGQAATSLLGSIKNVLLGLQPKFGDFVLMAVAIGLGYIIEKITRRSSITKSVVIYSVLIYLGLLMA